MLRLLLAGPTILAAITTVLTALIDAIIAVIPKVVDAFLLLITSLLESLTFLELCKPVWIYKFSTRIRFRRYSTGIDIVISIIDGLAQGIEENAPRIRFLFESLLKLLVFQAFLLKCLLILV